MFHCNFLLYHHHGQQNAATSTCIMYIVAVVKLHVNLIGTPGQNQVTVSGERQKQSEPTMT